MNAQETGAAPPFLRNPLVAHDLLVVRGLIRSLTARALDALSAVFLLFVVIAALRHGLAGLPVAYRSIAISVLPGIPATLLLVVLLRRLEFFRTQSVVANAALCRRPAAAYVGLFQLAASIAFSIAFFAPDGPAVVLSMASWWIALFVAFAIARGLRQVLSWLDTYGQDRLAQIVEARGSDRVRRAAMLAVAIAIATVSAVMSPTTAGIVSVVSVLAWGLFFVPISYPVIEYEGMVGRPLRDSLAGRLGYLAAATVGFAGASLASFDWRVGASIVSVGVALAAYKMLEILLARALGGSRVQFALAACLFVLVSVALVQPLAFAIIAPVLAYWLSRLARKRLWLIAS
ncbi:hypothetical protein K3172_15150 [Qipengyuania sp. 6B39]|uniref:hypothetical protein n=1 Tax=Qipengyuania proteolytica TaxID=2867239 RepID=UPI001C8A2CA2|nr:hypothetical protein [Qipengyuania proteolytica]MBX7497195.1 hypothetical protein [Qipengyuania proteolytica]